MEFCALKVASVRVEVSRGAYGAKRAVVCTYPRRSGNCEGAEIERKAQGMKGRRKERKEMGQEKRGKRLIAVVWLKVSAPSTVLFGHPNNSGAFADCSFKTSKSYGTSFFIPHNTSSLFLYEMCFVRLQQKMKNVSARYQSSDLTPTFCSTISFVCAFPSSYNKK